ncbi:MAG: ExeM/NucH family extracellular endonuclease [Idiomarina sp.]
MKTINYCALLLASWALAGCSPSAAISCADPISSISKIQGTGPISADVGKQVVTRGIVTADWRQPAQLGGFFIQSLPADSDDSDSSSEGLFIAYNSMQPTLSVGDIVTVQGLVSEANQQTQLEHLTHIEVCGSSEVPKPVELRLPVASVGVFESLEGMLVEFPQELVINGHYQLQRFGELVVSHERLFTPTQKVRGSAEVAALLATYQRQRLIIDDNSTLQYPAVIPFPTPQLTAANPIRSGDTLVQVTGHISEFNGDYKVQPQLPMVIAHRNPRPQPPAPPAVEHLRVSSFNVLNYFNGDGGENGFPTSRGAESVAELARQQAKIVAAMQALNADIIGVMEIENDGYGNDSAIAQLTAALAVASGHPWRFIQAGERQLGSDQITNGLLYRADRVSPAGDAMVLTSKPFDWGSRPPLAQAFNFQQQTDATVTVVVNHFKSKGSCPKDASNPNARQDDGMACWNVLRTESATALADWLGSPALTQLSNAQIVLGDFNAYAQEDPMHALAAGGYVNLMPEFAPNGYSYVYDAQAGSLDHILVNEALGNQVVELAYWHTNADEPRAFEYGLENKTDEQAKLWYQPNAYRASDHDPLYIDLRW